MIGYKWIERWNLNRNQNPLKPARTKKLDTTKHLFPVPKKSRHKKTILQNCKPVQPPKKANFEIGKAICSTISKLRVAFSPAIHLIWKFLSFFAIDLSAIFPISLPIPCDGTNDLWMGLAKKMSHSQTFTKNGHRSATEHTQLQDLALQLSILCSEIQWAERSSRVNSGGRIGTNKVKLRHSNRRKNVTDKKLRLLRNTYSHYIDRH